VSEFAAIPAELRERPQWICWAEQERNGKSTKIPKRPDGRGNAKANDMATWDSFEAAVAAAREREHWGIGFVFSEADPYVGVDLDSCLDDGRPREWLREIGTEAFAYETYIEISPSGTGLHPILKDSQIPEWWTNVDRDTAAGHEGVEVYESGRYFTFTGEPLDVSADTVSGDVDLSAWLKSAWREFEDTAPWEQSPQHTDRAGGAGDDINVGVHDILLRSNYPADERRGHPVHGSDTGSNFMVDEGAETWRCWRHGCTGNALHLVGMQEGLLDCGQWDGGHVSTETWREIFAAARERGLDVGEPDGQYTSATDEAQAGAETDGGTAAAEGGEAVGGPMALPERVRASVLTPLDPPEDYSGEEIDLGVALDRFANLLTDEYSFLKPRSDVRGWRDTLYVYVDDDGIYEPHGESFVKSETERLLGAVSNNQRCQEVFKKIRRQSLVRPGELTADPHRLVVANGIVDLHTGELSEHTPEEYHRTKLDIRYDSEAECPRIDEFYHEIVEDSDVRTLYQLVAHCIYKEYLEEKAAMLLGDGQNGKSVYISLLEEFLGQYNVSRRSLQDFSQNDYAANNLQGKLANLHPDMASQTVDQLGVFKQLTGRDTLVADVKYERPIKFQNHATLIFAANRMPKMTEDTHALWRRWIYVNFPYTFNEYDGDAKDPVPKRKLMAELTAEGELEGLLARAVEELNRWHEEGTLFTDVAAPEQVREKMKRASEPVYDYAMTCLDVVDDDDEAIPKDMVRQCYREFAREEGLPTIADNAFGERLMNLRDLPVESSQRRFDGERKHAYTGVRFTSRGRQILDLDGSDTDQSLDDAESETQLTKRVVETVRDLQPPKGEGGVTKGHVVGALASGGRAGVTNVQEAFETAKRKGDLTRTPGDGDGYRVS
jgi:putative DNA primase/helicase